MTSDNGEISPDLKESGLDLDGSQQNLAGFGLECLNFAGNVKGISSGQVSWV